MAELQNIPEQKNIPGQKHAPGQILASIRSILPSMLPAEQAVATVLLERADQVVELSSQQVADLAGASRATVVRSCQSLGFSGYQQLRVLLARDSGYSAATGPAPEAPELAGSSFIVNSSFSQVRDAVTSMTALLAPADVERSVQLISRAKRLVVAGNGLSAALAMDTASRLSAIGRAAEFQLDAIGQQIGARLLSEHDVLLVISGSGANTASLKVAQAAQLAGATVLAITAFSRSPLAALAELNLVVGMPELTFREEVTVTTRIPQTILVEALVSAVAAELGPVAARAKTMALEVIGDNLGE
ncbi:MurR/RpiR family transcriptional regulator [Psychromicrobium sp. YIM B11713]|uniref:MurR/RpiR family transcriptional regulator n=1 Tax=Psychromicrobium sp. YIM B11713 TaxID=3145233 RepID=UPI00374F4C74